MGHIWFLKCEGLFAPIKLDHESQQVLIKAADYAFFCLPVNQEEEGRPLQNDS